MSERETAGERPQPMSAERLARIRDWLDEAREIRDGPDIGSQWATSYAHDVAALLAEVERQGAALAARDGALLQAASERVALDSYLSHYQAAMEVVRVVAGAFSITGVIAFGYSDPHVCAVLPLRVIDRARALLASTPATDGGTAKEGE